MTYKIVPTPKLRLISIVSQIILELRVRPWLPIELDNGVIVLVPIVLLSIFRTMNSSYLLSKLVIDEISTSIKDTVNF